MSIYEQQQARKAATEERLLREPPVRWDADVLRRQYDRNAEYGVVRPAK